MNWDSLGWLVFAVTILFAASFTLRPILASGPKWLVRSNLEQAFILWGILAVLYVRPEWNKIHLIWLLPLWLVVGRLIAQRHISKQDAEASFDASPIFMAELPRLC